MKLEDEIVKSGHLERALKDANDDIAKLKKGLQAANAEIQRLRDLVVP